MAKSYFRTFIVCFLYCWASVLNAQVLELNAPEELPTPGESRIGSSGEHLSLDGMDIDRLLDFSSPDAQIEIEKEQRAKTDKFVVVDQAKPPANTKTLPVQVRELAGEPVMRGPIHEAFAEPFAMLPQDMQVIPQAPPVAVEEIPPSQPANAGNNTEWISGYWAWDTQAKDYIWISGVWRKKPKDRLWLPGRWEIVDGGHQWTPGAWMPTDGKEQVVVNKEVLPLPPKTLEQGPTSPAPSDQHFWVPGVWKHNNTKYAWRTGYWSRSQKNWVWVPDHYTSVAGGCVLVPGYWDYTWERRGTLYAPCTFDAVGADTICYRPTQVIDTNQWLTNLWVAPRTGHYHFGDYHDCSLSGYQPWYQYYGSNRSYYDPFYTYYRWQFPATYGIGMYGYLNGLHTYYGSHAAQRPRVSLYGYDTWARRDRGYQSFGDVRSLARLAGIDLNSRSRGHRHDYLDHLYDYGRGRDRDYGYRRDYDYGYRRPSDSYRSRPSKPERRLIGYANGAPLYSDQRTGGVKRAEIGVPRSRDYGARSQRSKSSNSKPRNNTNVEVRGPIFKKVTPENRSRPKPTATPRQRPISRPNTFAENNSKHRSSQATRSRPTQQVSRPQQTRAQSRPQSNRPNSTGAVFQSRPQTRSQARPQSRPQVRPQSRPQAARPQVKRPQTPRPKAVQSRPAPAARKPSGAGFSISGMKNSRNKADVVKQRAAMQNLIKQRKGR